MHPRTAALIAYSDAELESGRTQRIARHLQDCPKCQAALDCILHEKRDFAFAQESRRAAGASDGLTAVLATIARWGSGPEPELRRRARSEIEIYFGDAAASSIDGPDIPADELLAKTLALLDAFLGPEAAEAVLGDILRGLNCAALTAEVAP